MIQKSRSFQLKFVPTREKRTPILLPINPVPIIAIPTPPALNANVTSTWAPTRTKSKISAKIHILLSFWAKRSPILLNQAWKEQPRREILQKE